jgi:hypothetical protein
MRRADDAGAAACAWRCATCIHFDNRAAAVEAALPGLATFGSATSAARSSDGICRLHARYLAADRWCAQHEAVGILPTRRREDGIL